MAFRSSVGLREGLDALVVGLGAAGHALPPPVLNDSRNRLRARPVEAVEGTAREIDLSPGADPDAVEPPVGIFARWQCSSW